MADQSKDTTNGDTAVQDAEAQKTSALDQLKADLTDAEEKLAAATDADLKSLYEAQIKVLKVKIEKAKGTYQTWFGKIVSGSKSFMKNHNGLWEWLYRVAIAGLILYLIFGR